MVPCRSAALSLHWHQLPWAANGQGAVQQTGGRCADIRTTLLYVELKIPRCTGKESIICSQYICQNGRSLSVVAATALLQHKRTGLTSEV